MKPTFDALMQAYPRTTMRDELFTEIGWNDLTNNPAYGDTCAIRVSYGLLRAGVMLPGARMKINGGQVKGKYIEPGQGKLSNILKILWGKPEVYKGEAAARAGIGRRHGVVSFFRIHGGGPADGGHIDLVWGGPSGFQTCARSCYFSATTVWFWPLK
ncbi:T6SS effector amidase Tae4 family protein [Massilia sp. DWR3-1-1]|uniref:T6SS effector amidase Tae4 family protein n=1 Tax=Massilia sp. DWR3-1-1 TaxID=2804559 RepID=UPI003CF47E77